MISLLNYLHTVLIKKILLYVTQSKKKSLLLSISQKTTTRQPDSSSEREPQQPPKDSLPDVPEEIPKVVEPENRPRNDKPSKEKEDDGI